MSRVLLLSLLLAQTGCTFDPVVRQPKPEPLSQERTRVLSTLDARGEYALLAVLGEHATEPQLAITHWRRGERCDLPVVGVPVAAPLPRARTAAKAPVLYLPLAVASADEAPMLMLVDDRCQAHGPFGAIDPDTARTVINEDDQGGYLLYRDPSNRLHVLDPRQTLEPRPLLDGVTTMRATRETRGKERDAVWTIAEGELSLTTLDGETLATLGSDVGRLALSRDQTRIAFIDGEDLYEAIAPGFKANLVARDACTARYGGDTLEFYAPCAERVLRRVKLATGKYQEFEDGVFASSTQEGVQLDYQSDADGETVLSAAYPDGERPIVEPAFDGGHVYVIDQQRIAGLVDGERFGVWQRHDARFRPWIERVAEVVPHHRGKKHTFSWLIYHDVDEALGTLSLLDQDGAISEIARAVPLPAQQGFVIEDGSALAQYPFSAPLVVLLENAQPLIEAPGASFEPSATTAPRFCGRLKALSITGTPRAVLASDVCSYAIVAAPVPGVLYGVEAGADLGLWFVAL